MIKNDQQLRISLEKLSSMRDRLDRLRAKHPKKVDFEFYSESVQRQINDMVREKELYELAKSRNIDALIIAWNEDGRIKPETSQDLALGDFISLVRVARGWTQAQLALELGIEQSNMARYERDDYAGYSIETLDKIFGALGLRLTLGKIGLGRAA